MKGISIKVFGYDSNNASNNFKGEEYSKYAIIGDTSIDNLDDTLDTYELTLSGLPFREEFEPTFKFIIEKWQDDSLYKTWNMIVNNDAVTQPILSDDNYFDHHITLIEAAVEAQQRLVDNISVTYKLEDVTLDKKPTYDVDAKINVNKINALPGYHSTPYTPKKYSGVLDWKSDHVIGHSFKWVMPNYYNVTLKNENNEEVTEIPSWDSWNNFKQNQVIPYGSSNKTVSLPIPMLQCWGWVEDSHETSNFNGYCSIDVIINEKSKNTIKNTITYQVNPCSLFSEEKDWNIDAYDEDLFSRYYGHILSRRTPDTYVGKVSILGSSKNGIPNKEETFTTLTNRVLTITLSPEYNYEILFRIHTFNNYDFTNADIKAYGKAVDYKYDKYPYVYCHAWIVGFKDGINDSAIQTSDTLPLVNTKFNAFLEGEKGKIVFQSAPPATAYDLFNKSQLSSQIFLKSKDYIVDETPKPFYLRDSDVQQLKNTKIIESFFNQYNQWQIFMDIGKYIHARPVITFGEDNNFKVTWKKYGLTQQNKDINEPISVYNSRFVEEYISACSSYITNMVQLDGIITETVAPKSSSEDYLVYNDVAEIIVSKPIIEIISLDVIRKRDNATRNLTGNGTHGESASGYVFEKSVYNLFSIDNLDSINKGMAIYYELGTNKIVGLNYRLPVTHTGETENDYSIKKIIGKVFGYSTSDWKSIKVNDFLFKIVYRTKDTLRSNQTRPDLRKYLLSSRFDRVPQHNQFNNQQDIVVDSAKFGNNIYGKLIRTGNTVYTVIEWVDNLFKLKQSGELYNIYGNLYYVSKVKNTYYPDHIISEVEFSKDFNRLSQIIGIPSEPRFYEISEQSFIEREVSVDDFLVVGTNVKTTSNENSFIKNKGWEYIKGLLFENEIEYPQYAVTVFKDDVLKGNDNFKIEVCHPISTYSIQNTLTLEWDMEDNFSAGNQVKVPEYILDNSTDAAYNTLIPFSYTDKFGRVDMFDFAIIKSASLTSEQVMLLPENKINLNSPTTSTSENYLFGNCELGSFGSKEKGIVLLKDNREVIKLNYNIQLITDSDRFVLSSYIWQNEKQNLRLALLNEEVNKISNDILENKLFEVEDIPFETSVEENYIRIKISDALASYDLTDIKAIAIYSTNLINDYTNSGAKYFVMARNISNLSAEESDARSDWYISNFDKSMFKKQ